MVEHVVMPGETLGGIAARLGTTLEDLLDRNPKLWLNPDLIRVGQKIDVPAPKLAVDDSGPPPEIAAEQPAPPVLRLTHRPVTATVQPCARDTAAEEPIDPLVLETLSVWDDEDSGKRYWDEGSRTLHIVQTGPTDRVVIRYTGPNPPGALDVYCHGRLLDKARGGGTYLYDVTYAPWKDPYDNPALGLIRATATAQMVPCDYRFCAPQFTVYVRVYNPDQWKLKVAFKPVMKQKIAYEYSSPESRKAEAYVLAERRRTAVVLNPVTGDAMAVAQVQGRADHLSVAEQESRRVTKTTQTSAWGRLTTTQSIESSYTERTTSLRSLTYEAGLYVQQGQGQGHALAYASAAAAHSTLSERIWNSRSALSSEPSTQKVQDIGLSRNGVVVDVPLLRVVAGALALSSQLSRIIEAIQDTVPKIGWFFEMEWAVLAGEVTATLGWREDTDHRVYYGFAADGSVVILSANGKIGVGLSVAGVKC